MVAAAGGAELCGDWMIAWGVRVLCVCGVMCVCVWVGLVVVGIPLGGPPSPGSAMGVWVYGCVFVLVAGCADVLHGESRARLRIFSLAVCVLRFGLSRYVAMRD